MEEELGLCSCKRHSERLSDIKWVRFQWQPLPKTRVVQINTSGAQTSERVCYSEDPTYPFIVDHPYNAVDVTPTETISEILISYGVVLLSYSQPDVRPSFL